MFYYSATAVCLSDRGMNKYIWNYAAYVYLRTKFRLFCSKNASKYHNRLNALWPSGWLWHGGEVQYYFQMICGVYFVLGVYLIAAARNPAEHATVISFAMRSSWRRSRSRTRMKEAICWA
ncbi:MAG: DUF6632 domain-containing protein, partial [Methylocystis sp.]